MAADAEIIVSCNAGWLDLKQFHGVLISTPKEALGRIAAWQTRLKTRRLIHSRAILGESNMQRVGREIELHSRLNAYH
jgi:hypothetical protein